MTTEPIDFGAEPIRGRPFWSHHLRREVQFLLDLAALIAAFALAYLLRFEFEIPTHRLGSAMIQLPLVVLLQFSVLLLSGAYRFVWRYFGMAEMWTFVRAAFYSVVPLLLMRLGLPESFDAWRIPLSVILMDTVFAFAGVLGLRVLRRALYERFERSRREVAAHGHRSHPVILVGAGRAGVLTAREVSGRGDLEIVPVGFVDDDPLKQGSVIHGLKVLGSTDDLPRLAARHGVERVVITIAETGAETIRRIVEICDRVGLRVQIIPGLYEILQGRVSISRFRDVLIEDLLGREQVRLDKGEVRRFLTDKCVLITGAGGSIGAELARQCARFSPARLVLVERFENALFEIDRELRQLWPGLEVVPRIADVGDEARMRRVLEEQRPHIIMHAAAHKHVPMMEKNPSEAVRNNVLATALLGRLAGTYGVGAFVLISTDKAVRPSSIMGACKRVAELVIQDLDRQFERSRFLAVRFGNVLGSAGSVVAIFREQIARGGPVTVTHPEATRYFMTIGEAAQLVLEAGAIGAGGEIMILDMGEPIRILDLARDMISLSGFKPFEEVPIVYTGLRPGEKLREELELDGEGIDRTRHPKIFLGRLSTLPPDEIRQALARLEELAADGGRDEIRSYLEELLPEASLASDSALAAPPASEPGRGLVH